MKLASPGFSSLNLSREATSYYSDFFAQQLTQEGVRVVTASEVQAVIGIERQKQLLGCADSSSCIVEIANALGVDGVIVGSIGKLEDRYQVTVKIVSAKDGSLIGAYSVQATGDKDLVEKLTRIASETAPEIAGKVNKPLGAKSRSFDHHTPKNTITINLFELIVLGIQLEYERAFGHYVSMYLAPTLLLTDASLGSIGSTSASVHASSSSAMRRAASSWRPTSGCSC